ncbi:MAG: hypothetical protein KJ042_17930 [Deltaproteobacteria bacterium]|nr:hypothetical protein [Deltaproteobacteria bacterium]
MTTIYGRGLAIEYTENGVVERATRIGFGGARSIRIGPRRYHAIVPQDEGLMIHEVASGPFLPGVTTQYATWASNAEGMAGRLVCTVSVPGDLGASDMR